MRNTMLIQCAAVVALLVGGASAAGAQQVPPSSGRLVVGAGQVPAAGTVAVSGSGCASRAGVVMTVAGQPAGSTIADTKGAFARTVTIPSAALGQVTATATCAGPRGETHIVTGPVVVTDNAAGSQPLPPPREPARGIPTSAVLAFFVVCAVAVLVAAALRLRRRLRPRHAPVPAPALAPAPAPVPRVPVVMPAPAEVPARAELPAEPAPAMSNAELLQLAAGVAGALERVTSVSERVIAHVEYSRAQLQATLAAEREDRRATLDALHALVRTIDARVNEPATDLSALQTRSSSRRDP